jgi:hypothetical protein
MNTVSSAVRLLMILLRSQRPYHVGTHGMTILPLDLDPMF